ncbi:murein hydrolase activator EnvC family protein [Alkalilimnicola sp. S0819]|uniref:murein hydrolase activator EnvC family protein n=1 Tax=Alkalilimnicola sp. S0819 TaxID=2613922 RepID=UPI00186A390A|nr:peptidoglycan DD-metalloendopeptidase family protein [Alkalilimnicola sp. S0819]
MGFLRLAPLLLALAAFGAPAQEYREREAELRELRERITQVREDMRRAQQRRDAAQTELGRLERRLGRAAAALREIAGRRQQVDARVSRLRAEQGRQSELLSEQRAYLARALREAYAGGRQEYLKLLLNQQDPSQFQRLLVYYDYFNRARAARIAEVTEALQALARTREELDQALAELDGLARARRAEHERLQAARTERQALLARIGRELESRGGELAALKVDEQELTKLLQELNRALADIPESALDRKPFPQTRGTLPWPAKGRLTARYGQARGLGDMRWSGVLIGAESGAEVRAVSHGRVVYSDWLRGFGLLLIVDHGEGYMSLYGHNQSLYKEAGDWVEAGELLARVGSSGGRDKPGLYFEIRAAGKPVDPQRWLRAKDQRG